MHSRTRCILLLTVLACFASIRPANAQVLTKATDPANPVVNDQYESGGGSWIDVDRDGYLDLFVAHGNLSNQNNSLYVNDRAGGFKKITTGAMVTDGGSSIGSTWGDFNNDGNLDLFVTNRGSFGNFLYLGNGDTTFVKVTTGSIVTDHANSNSGSWVDLDGDGILDLYVVNFQGNDYFYRGNGSPQFDFTRVDTILPVNDGANFSIAGSWGDMNNDRRPDLFVGNAGTQNDALYINNGNLQFTKITVADGKATLGGSWGDYDNDGNLDFVACNYTGQTNILYHNSGPPSYQLIPVGGSSVSLDAGNYVGSAWGDYDNDGHLDLFIANDGGQSLLLHNDGPPNYTFTKITGADPVTNVGNSFGAGWADYDGDGQLDLFVANRLNQKDFLYHNGGDSNHWVEFNCTATATSKSAIGAKVRLKATVNGAPEWQLREVPAQTGYNSQNLTLHFGLGDASTIDSLRVEWPSGADELFAGVAANRHYYIAERDSTPPILIIPPNGAQNLTPEITFQWDRSLYGAPYWLQVSSDSGFTSGFEINDSTVSDTFVSRTLSITSGHLFWRVRSARSIHTGIWSGTFDFAVNGIFFNSNVSAGWNLISLPVSAGNSSTSHLYPGASGRAFGYDGSSYTIEDTLRAGRGYWLRFGGSHNFQIVGNPVGSDTISVTSGWNLIGTITDPVAVQSVASNPPGIIASRFFGYHSGYFSADSLLPGQGYWVKVNESGQLFLSGTKAAPRR
jgi:hypothetical protein